MRRRKRQPTPIFLPGKPYGQRSLTGYGPWDHKESDTTERLTHTHTQSLVGFPGGAVVKKPPTSAEDLDLIPGSGRAPGGGNGYPLQYSCLENPMDRGAWWVPGHGVAKSRTQLKQLSIHSIQLLNLLGPSRRPKPLPWILLSPFLLSALFALRGA